MRTKPVELLIVTLSLALAGLGLAAAQSETPTAPAVDLLCDLAQLRQQQTELAASLDTFDQDMQTSPAETLDRLFKVGAAYQELALDCGYIPPDAAARSVGTDVERILRALETVAGDPINGQVLYNNPELACGSCHFTSGGTVAPHTEGTFTRVEETRLNDPALAGYTPEQYLVESIVQPAHYVTPNYVAVMPTDFGERLTLQDMADLLTFLESQDGPSPE